MGRQRGFALVELLVVIAIIALLMAILLPALNRAREQGKRAVCLSNVKQLTIAWIMYADDNEGKISDYAWAVYHKVPEWLDLPPLRHGNGTTFSFADGHSEYWKWKDARTIKLGNGEITTTNQPGNPDLVRVQMAHWGELGYTP